MKLFTLTVVFALLLLVSVGVVVNGDDVGVYNMPNSVGPGQKFKVEYINMDAGNNVTVEFHPVLSQLLPYQYSADEYHGKKYGNITRLIEISRSLSPAWSASPQKLNLRNTDARFNITVSLSYAGYWDMLLIFKYPNGTENFMIHSLPQVVKSTSFGEVLPWVVIYLGSVFVVVFIIAPLWLKRKIKYISSKNRDSSRSENYN